MGNGLSVDVGILHGLQQPRSLDGRRLVLFDSRAFSDVAREPLRQSPPGSPRPER